MADQDFNQQTADMVRKATQSPPVDGEELLESEELKKQFREIKKQLPKPSGEQPVK
jgi:hypothetical protein